ncbi:unnamed protein product [Choristocarpus tenellus]
MGVSPEFELALYTMLFLLDKVCIGALAYCLIGSGCIFSLV